MRAQSLFHCRKYHTVNGFFIIKLYFRFGRVYIYIDVRRINIQEKHVKRMLVGQDQTLVGIAYSMMQVIAFDVPVVDIEKLVSPGFLGTLRLADVTLDLHMGRSFLAGYQLPLIILSEQVNYSMAKFTWNQIKQFHVILKKIEADLGV